MYKKIILTKPDVFNHNIETVPSNYTKVRPGSRYFQSINLLKEVKDYNNKIFTKSGLMLGLGEKENELFQVMDDLRCAGVDFLTLGQYLQPTEKHYPIKKFIPPEDFEKFKKIAYSKGFSISILKSYDESSYHADDDFQKLKEKRQNNLI